MTARATNWAGNVTFAARRRHRPSSVDELRRVVVAAERVRPLGTGHSFNRLADTDGDHVSLAGLPHDLRLNPRRRTVTVSAGIRYGELATLLHSAGWALPNLASLPHISVAGAVATGTHGSGERNGSLASSVTGLELVTADGDLVTLDRDADPARFPGAVVALGGLGVVTRLTLDLVPSFEVAQYVYRELPAAALRSEHRALLGGGYSVSLFTDWTGPRINQVWVKHRVGDPPAARPDRFGAIPAEQPLHPVPGMSAVNCTEQLGVAGPWYDRLPHFRLQFTPSSGEELQSEYLVSRDRAVEALDAVDRVRDRVAPVLQISEIRTVAADELWLSPAYRRDSVAIHFTWIADTAAVLPAVEAVEEQLAPFAYRPHWGKVFHLAPEPLAQRYDRYDDFRALLRHYDPGGKFRNALLDRYFPADR